MTDLCLHLTSLQPIPPHDFVWLGSPTLQSNSLLVVNLYKNDVSRRLDGPCQLKFEKSELWGFQKLG